MRIVNRFYVTLIIQALWNLEETYRVALRFKVNRGLVQSLMGQTASNAGCITRFCEHMSEFWALASILSVVVEKLRHCCSPELIPLMELPSVQLVRFITFLYFHKENIPVLIVAGESQTTLCCRIQDH